MEKTHRQLMLLEGTIDLIIIIIMLHREMIAVCFQTHTKHINTLYGKNIQFLWAFAKLRKATISFAIPGRVSICPHGTARLPVDGFS